MASDKRWDTLIQPRKWLTDLEKSIESYIERGDSINVWGLPSTGTTSQLRKLTERTDPSIGFIFLDTQWLSSVSSKSFFELLNSYLTELVDTETVNRVANLSPIMQTQKLLQTIVKEKNLCIVIDNMEDLSNLDNTFFSSVKALRDKFFSHLCFIFVSNRPLYDHKDFKDNEDFIDFACHREVPAIPLNEDETSSAVIKTLEYFKTELDPSKQDKVAELTGGSLGLLKSVLRVIEKGTDSEIDESILLKEPSIKNRINRICDVMTKEEVAYLKSIASGKAPKSKITPFLHKSGLVKGGTIQSSLIKKAILIGCGSNKAHFQKASTLSDSAPSIPQNGLSFDFVSGEIFKDGKRLTETLSKTEAQIVKKMIDTPGTLITREGIAKAIWGDETQEKYSEWAIDKTISRIRQKIDDSRRPYKHLITIKGRGFKLYPSTK